MPAMFEEYQQAWDELTAPGAQFAIKVIEVRGVPIRVFESALPSMRTVWEMAKGYGDRDYIVYEDERSRTPRPTRSSVRSPHLVDVHGVQPGDRVALAMRNYPEWVIGYWATVSIGAAVRRDERLVDDRGDGVRLGRLEAGGVDRRRRARRADPAGARRAAGGQPART